MGAGDEFFAMPHLHRALLLLLCCGFISTLQALDSPAKEEVTHLLEAVSKSEARFIRNGTEYSSAEGAEHLKYKLGQAGDRVKTAEDFIEGIGTKSYLSGKPYLMKNKDGTTTEVGPWLTKVLEEYRKGR
jgi:hypothetical protein